QDLDPHLRHEVHAVLSSAVDLGVAALTAVPLDLADRDAGDSEAFQGSLHVIELERLDDSGDEPHAFTSSRGTLMVLPLELLPSDPPLNSPPDSYAVS